LVYLNPIMNDIYKIRIYYKYGKFVILTLSITSFTSISMDRRLIALSIILTIGIIPAVNANPIPIEFYVNSQAGGCPRPYDENTSNITFFKEVVKADIQKRSVNLHADYWFRNEGTRTETIKILLPLSNEPKDISLISDGKKVVWSTTVYVQTGWYFGYATKYQAIYFEQEFMPSQEIKVSLDFEDDLSIYDEHMNDHISYYYSYLVGSAREWNRSIESARFEFRVPVSMFDRGEYKGWDRSREAFDYVFTKEYSDWIPSHDLEWLMWEQDRMTLEVLMEKHPYLMDAIGAAMFVLVLTGALLAILTMLSRMRARNKVLPKPLLKDRT